MRPLVLLRPEPGLGRSRARAEALGLPVIAAPLFAIEPVAFAPPDGRYDALLVTSANAMTVPFPPSLAGLPVHAVGAASAEAARAAGFSVASVGRGGVRDLLAGLPRPLRLLHLAGENFHEHDDPRVTRLITYRAVECGALPDIRGTVIAVHSPRAGRRLAALAPSRDARIAAISPAAAEACGDGWRERIAAPSPDDAALLALAARLCQT